MFQLVEFLSRNRSFILFVLLEVFCFSLIIRSNSYWGATYFNTANYYVAQILTVSNALRDYSNLKDENANLAAENLRLNQLVTELHEQNPTDAPTGYQPDSAFASRFKYKVAKVVEKDIRRSNNYITIDKGTLEGIAPGMGVISATGVVGKVSFCSDHYSIVTSILHSQFMVSTRLVRSNEIGPAKWSGKDPSVVDLMDISRYKKVVKGDSAVTSNLNSVFPPGIMVGTVKNIAIRQDQTFFDIELELATDFPNLTYVYVVQNLLQDEKNKLLQRIDQDNK
jgi:rod shape-determining protein MreC